MRWTGLLSLSILCVVAQAGVAVPAQAAPRAPSAELDVLFVGAHPDDEAFTLSTLGQLKLRTGVVTVTRGEGGGNAVGPEEGPDLGRIREAEERRAVGRAGIADVFNLDKADFYYTVSSPLTEQAWGREHTLGKLVRVIRQTRPKVVFTMDPAPSPGNHGHHQFAARLAVEAYELAADPKAFPEQGLRPWAVQRLFGSDANVEAVTGPRCESDFRQTEPADRIWGAWAGVPAGGGQTWAQVERAAQREYASQGWAGFPDVPTDPARIGCDYFVQLASRVPYDVTHRGAAGMVSGGPTLYAKADRYAVTAGSSVRIKVTSERHERVTLAAPAGWTVRGDTVTVAPDAKPGKVRIGVRQGRWATEALVEVVPPVVATQQPLPQVAQYAEWARGIGYPELADSVTPVLTLPSGGSRDIDITVRNQGQTAQAGTVELGLPAGFATDGTKTYPRLEPGASATVRFTVRNTDAGLPTGQRGGDYRYTITTTPGGTNHAALELVPATTIGQATAEPVVDGVAGAGEYPGPSLDISSRWEGDECTSAADCSGTAQLSWRGDTLYALVTVTDDVIGTRLATADCKRHWRTDSVELTLDPRGSSENTSTTYKLAALPVTAEGPPCVLRDADNRQGAAPGVRVAAKAAAAGYTVEVAIPLAELPGAVDPANLGLNVLVYDSDTQDKTGQTRIGWSTWGGVQGDPYRWGRATVDGYSPPPGRPTEPPAPVLPLEALASVDSPQSIEQSVRLGLPPGANPAARPIRVKSGRLIVTEKGTAYVFADGKRSVRQVSPGVTRLPAGRVLVGFVNARGGTAAAIG